MAYTGQANEPQKMSMMGNYQEVFPWTDEGFESGVTAARSFRGGQPKAISVGI